MAAGQYVAAFLVFAGLIVIGIVPAVVVESPLQPAPQGFGQGSPEYHYIKKQCPTTKIWSLATNERDISNEFFEQLVDVPDPRSLNTFAWAWGQFIDHDIVLTETDPDTQLTIDQLNVTRTVKDSITGETKTFITSAIDASTVYGDYRNPGHIVLLREAGKCTMKTSMGPDGPLLPLDTGLVGDGGFISGDVRSDEHAVLSSLHTLWVREHNRLCGVLPQRWTANERFWSARRAVIEQINHITYNEWLPALFGSQSYLLGQKPSSYSKHLTDVFAGAAYRFGHSMVGDTVGEIPLLDLFFNAEDLQEHGIAYYIELAAQTPAQKVDTKVVDGLRNIMFGSEDLVTRNLFRGRDMGLPTYQEIASCYGFPATNSHEDPLLGLLSEPLVEGSSLPLGIATIIAEQFNRLRDPDISCPYYLLSSCSFKSVIERNTNLKGVGFYYGQ